MAVCSVLHWTLFLLIGCSRECHVERFMSIEFNIFLNLIPFSFNTMHNSSNLFSRFQFFLLLPPLTLRFLTKFYGKSLKKSLVLFHFAFARLSRCFVLSDEIFFIIPGRSFSFLLLSRETTKKNTKKEEERKA